LLLIRRWDNNKTRGKARTSPCWWLLVWGMLQAWLFANDDAGDASARVNTAATESERKRTPQPRHNCSSEQRASFSFCSLSLSLPSVLSTVFTPRPKTHPHLAKRICKLALKNASKLWLNLTVNVD
jgi:hypothetical protein